MFSKFLIIGFILIIIYSVGVKSVTTFGGPMWRTDVRCAEVVSRRIKRLRDDVVNCSHIFDVKNLKERDQKIYCILKCAAINEGILTTQGLVEWDSLAAFVGKDLPPNFLARAIPLYRKCYDLAHDKLDPTEELCRSYKPFHMCIIEATTNMCKEKREVTTLISVTD